MASMGRPVGRPGVRLGVRHHRKLEQGIGQSSGAWRGRRSMNRGIARLDSATSKQAAAPVPTLSATASAKGPKASCALA
jgi:hypothetical protein